MDIVLTLLLLLLLTAYIIKAMVNRFHLPSERYLWTLFIVHALMTAIYMLYAALTTSDSIAYFNKSAGVTSWLPVGHRHNIHTLFAWPFTGLFGLSYYVTMIIFSFFGFMAIMLFFISRQENVRLEPVWMNLTAIELVFLLPNTHFWSSSLGKGA